MFAMRARIKYPKVYNAGSPLGFSSTANIETPYKVYQSVGRTRSGCQADDDVIMSFFCS